MEKKSILLAQVVQLVNQANQLLVAVAEYTGESLIPAEKPKAETPVRTKEPKEIVNVKEASEILGRSKQAIYQLINRGEIARHGGGRIAYFKRSDLLDFMLRGKKSSNAEISDRADAILNRRRK